MCFAVFFMSVKHQSLAPLFLLNLFLYNEKKNKTGCVNACNVNIVCALRMCNTAIPVDQYSISIQDPGNNNFNNNYIMPGTFWLRWKITMVKIYIEHGTDLF